MDVGGAAPELQAALRLARVAGFCTRAEGKPRKPPAKATISSTSTIASCTIHRFIVLLTVRRCLGFLHDSSADTDDSPDISSRKARQEKTERKCLVVSCNSCKR